MRAFRYAGGIGLVVCACVPIFPGPICTMQFVYGLTVVVADEDGAPVVGATLTLTDGAYLETMIEPAPDFEPGMYIGAGERAGTYTLTVEAEGFEPLTIENIGITEDICHVIPVSREVTLTPI